MPTLNIYKAAPTKKEHVLQTYYVDGLNVVVYKDGGVMIAYNTPRKQVRKKNFRSDTIMAKWFIEMVTSKSK